ncbi:MAG: FAD-dependent oxidoreductase [Oscillibacter sp.]|nr:FAD-dependent oxidoreductase [Oscillibacter sp.]
MESIWTRTADLPRFQPLDGDLKTDVLVIGGGITGILCAWTLRRRGVDCALIEADRLCGGTTGHTTAKITSQHGLVYHRLMKEFGADAARLCWQAQEAALERYRELCREIPCDFEEKDNFVYALDSRAELEKELEALERIGAPARFAGELPLPFPTAGAVSLPRQGQFHPLKFLAALVKDLPVYEHTRALEWSPGLVRAERGIIRAEKVIAATHFPFITNHGGYFLKLCQHRSYVLALENGPDAGGMYVDASKTGMSFRNFGSLLLLGGGGHRTGKQGGGWQELEDAARRYYPHAKVTGRWAAQDCMSLDGAPYIGQYGRRTPGLYTASGFNKWGMTGAMAASELLADLVLGRENPYAGIFDPSRTILRPQLAANVLESTVNLLTPTVPRCPHLGCALKYNPQEHTWDCPCHGSRFRSDGAVLDGPANGDKPM